MDIQKAYDQWSQTYDTNLNKTRDLEALSLKTSLADIEFDTCLEIGCGTGKNTEWLLLNSKHVTCVDLSESMLARAQQKIKSKQVQFIQADINKSWSFTNSQFELVTFSLVLEHIEDLNDIFNKVSKVTTANAYVYIGELHPYKQYMGSKARFETKEGQQIVTCFNHNITDFTSAAKKNGFEIIEIQEFFDDYNRTSIPRILAMLFKKIS
jgi:ubiquinone/menaquinone biosynthesis C-methylase UbiE